MKEIEELLQIMKTLRDPEQGCSWDKAQTCQSILAYTLEEVYELAEAIENNATDEIRDELGDLLFHIVFYARIAEEEGKFSFTDIVKGVSDKLTRRHPHVFADKTINDGKQLNTLWEQIKSEERQQQSGEATSVMDNITTTLPALIMANKIQKRAAAVGFDWKELSPVKDKVREELSEIEKELNDGGDVEKLTEEAGDLLFACVNLARHLGVEPEMALRQTNKKFIDRFHYIEEKLKEKNSSPQEASLEEMDKLWEEAKTSPK